jgi:NAD(P)-dependent dehydrogenase (short-subunit alcohol dehydrogenase family)
MNLVDQVVLVTGGASGLGAATVRHASVQGARVVIADLPSSSGAELADALGPGVTFVPTDVTDTAQVEAAVATATALGTLRGVVHTAGRGGPVRLVDRDGNAGDAAAFEHVVRVNLVGSFRVASVAAAAMARNEPSGGDRGAIVLTASLAAFEGQIGQAAYASSKAGVVGLTLVAARDLSARGIRVCTIAPGVMDTPMLAGLRDDIRAALADGVPHPKRLGSPEEYASLAWHILGNGYLNGETFRLDGALRMAPR